MKFITVLTRTKQGSDKNQVENKIVEIDQDKYLPILCSAIRAYLAEAIEVCPEAEVVAPMNEEANGLRFFMTQDGDIRAYDMMNTFVRELEYGALLISTIALTEELDFVPQNCVPQKIL